MYIVYKTINNLNGRYYFGVHKQLKDDSYLGSGRALRRAIRKYGTKNFTRVTIETFLSKEEAYSYEQKIVQEHLLDPLCYNLMQGGYGGFDHINSNPSKINPMKVPEYRERQKLSAKQRLREDKEWAERKRKISTENAKKASQSNKGKKRPQHSIIMKERSSLVKLYKEDRERYRDILASTFQVVSPTGEYYNTNRLEDFCKERNLGYVPLWNTSRTGRPVTKGKSKGWLCKKI